MSEKQLREMLAQASDFAAKRFAQKGVLYPQYNMVTSAGEHLHELGPSTDKDTAVAIIRAFMEIKDVVRYVFLDEAWTLYKLIQPAEFERIDREGLRNHPERVEIVMFQCEDADWGQITAHRLIHRPAGRKPYLGPLVTLDELAHLPPGSVIQSEGRMVGLLPQRGTRQ
jgi:hypothetical protein